MKFLMTLYQIQDYGGIINHAEHLARGLRILGHEVDFRMLVPKYKIGATREPKDIEQYRRFGSGFQFHQANGWYGLPRVPYLETGALWAFKERCSKYDAVLWHIPVPTLNKENKGIHEWTKLYDHGSKNIAIIHDGNLPQLYPHLNHVADHFHAAVCVHESAMNSGQMLAMPRKLILNPFDTKTADGWTDFHNRNGFAAIQVFKAWKRVDTLIRAIPHIGKVGVQPRWGILNKMIVGGAGIEYRYMTSKDKCKPQYFNPETGERIWDEALARGMDYKGTLPSEEVFSHLKKVRLQIDPSFSKKYAAYGAHFNRTTIEAIICGAVPMATDWGMKNSSIFLSHHNYIPIPANCEPKVFAQLIEEAHYNKDWWLRVKENNLHLLKKFDMRGIAQQYVDLVKSDAPHHLGPTGHPMPIDIKRCNKNLEFFGLGHSDAATGAQTNLGL